MAFDDEKTVSVRADTVEVERSLENLERLSRGFGRSLTSALEGAAVRGRSLSDVLRGLGSRLVELSFIEALDLGLAIIAANTYSGSAIGRRYNVVANAVINTAGAGATALPGSIAGVSATGGQYV